MQNYHQKINQNNNEINLIPQIRIPLDTRTNILKNKIRKCLKPNDQLKQDIHYKHMFPKENIQINPITNKCLALHITKPI